MLDRGGECFGCIMPRTSKYDLLFRSLEQASTHARKMRSRTLRFLLSMAVLEASALFESDNRKRYQRLKGAGHGKSGRGGIPVDSHRGSAVRNGRRKVSRRRRP
jgi:hypothetical protein